MKSYNSRFDRVTELLTFKVDHGCSYLSTLLHIYYLFICLLPTLNCELLTNLTGHEKNTIVKYTEYIDEHSPTPVVDKSHKTSRPSGILCILLKKNINTY